MTYIALQEKLRAADRKLGELGDSYIGSTYCDYTNKHYRAVYKYMSGEIELKSICNGEDMPTTFDEYQIAMKKMEEAKEDATRGAKETYRLVSKVDIEELINDGATDTNKDS